MVPRYCSRAAHMLLTVAFSLASLFVQAQNWRSVSSPNPGTQTNALLAVGAVSKTDAWAVGYDYSNYTQPKSLVEHWNGTQWSVVPAPSPGDEAVCGPNEWDALSAVTAISSTQAWAAGHYCVWNSEPFIISWNGTSWSNVKVPKPAGANSTVLSGIAATSSSDVWAVGSYIGRAGSYQSLVEHWNGTSWVAVSTPNPPQSNAYLLGVSATSSQDVWAVGYYWSQSTHNLGVPLTEHWDGSKWSIVDCPGPASENSVVLNGVMAIGANGVWAVGTSGSGLTMHWDGSEWLQVQSPTNQDAITLTAIAAASSSDAWAVGYTQGDTLQPWTQHWDGTSWTEASTPDPGVDGILFAVGTYGGNYWTTGEYTNEGLSYSTLIDPLTLIEQR